MSKSTSNAANQTQLSIDTTRILVKNLPPNFTASDKWEFFQLFGATETKLIGRTTAIAQFPPNVDTKSIINLLHQRPINGQILHAEFAKTNPPARTTTLQGPPTTDKDPGQMAFEEATSKLHQYLQALKSHHDFDHPPPPHLRYCYPKLNRDIMDAICIALETSPKFYTQVLHLMNRMNLEPPFVPGSKNLQYPRVKCDSACQTDSNAQYPAHLSADLASDESELSDSSSVQPVSLTKKRKTTDESQQQASKQKRLRSMLHSQKVRLKEPTWDTTKVGYSSKENLSTAFENSIPVVERNIKILAPDKIAPQNLQDFLSTTIEETPPTVEEEFSKMLSISIETCITDEELQSNRIPMKQWSLLPLFANYNAGEPSNKLYIKNLAKNVEENDLLRIYRRYHNAVDAKLMRTGRMKGQAFITFDFPIMEQINIEIMAKALNETNGFILKDKIMVVMYGKKS